MEFRKNWNAARLALVAVLVAASVSACRGGCFNDDESRENETATGGASGSNASSKERKGSADVSGKSGKIDYVRAVEELQKAADDGDLDAQADLALLYWEGWGTPRRNLELAFKLASAPAEAGNPYARYVLWHSSSVDEATRNVYSSQAYKEFKKRSEAGDGRATYYLGWCYANGSGTLFNPAQARKEFKKAAETGYCEAASITAALKMAETLFETTGCGLGAPEARQAIAGWRRAADGGSEQAVRALIDYSLLNGNSYFECRDNGAEKDVKELARWLPVACESGMIYAMKLAGGAAAAQENGAEAEKWWRKAAEAGSVEACGFLAQAYSKGYYGFDCDPSKADEWLAEAERLKERNAESDLIKSPRSGLLSELSTLSNPAGELLLWEPYEAVDSLDAIESFLFREALVEEFRRSF